MIGSPISRTRISSFEVQTSLPVSSRTMAELCIIIFGGILFRLDTKTLADCKKDDMRNRGWTLEAACLLGMGVLFGCVSPVPPAPNTVIPLGVDSADGPLMAALVHEQDKRVEACETRMSCPQDYYLRGLLALFHSRDQAVAAFQQVRFLAPNTRLATWSTSWVEVLQPNPSADMSKVIEDQVWEVLERELSEAPNESVRTLWSDRAQRVGLLIGRRPAMSPDQGSIPEGKDPATMQMLRKRLRESERIITERDQQIAVLTS